MEIDRSRTRREHGGETSEKVVRTAIESLGKGFDVNNDFRLKYCRGQERLVVLNEEKAELAVPGFGVFGGVSVDIKCDKGDRVRHQSDFLGFKQMSELLNRRSSISGRFPSGMFNYAYGFPSETWSQDAKTTRFLAFNGCFITLLELRINRRSLALSDDVVAAVPSSWDPIALARFIATFGTHVVSGLSLGGQDVVFVRQDLSSHSPTSELKEHLDKLGDQLFSETCALPMHCKKKNSPKLPEVFNFFRNNRILGDGSTSVSSKKGVTVTWSKRGGDASAQGHSEWLLTVPTAPDAINFTFTPITSLLGNVPGKGFLSHAIGLYLRYKPPIRDLEYFLGFQSNKIWAPVLNDLPLGHFSSRIVNTASLQFNMMGPKLFVNTNHVIVAVPPVIGMRLHLEGKRNNRLAVHLQHLSASPSHLTRKIREGSLEREAEDGADERFYLAVKKKKFSHVCTAPVKYDPAWKTVEGGDATFIVTGARLAVKNHERRSVLHLALTYSAVPGFFVERSLWEGGQSTLSQRSGLFSTMGTTFTAERETASALANAAGSKPSLASDSGVFSGAPPVPVNDQKLLRFVDTSHVCRGPQDTPGHWLVTGARLELKNGKICLFVKFSLLVSSLLET